MTLRDHVPGAAVFTIAWLALTALGGLIFAELIQKSTVLYGTIGGIFGFLGFLGRADEPAHPTGSFMSKNHRFR